MAEKKRTLTESEIAFVKEQARLLAADLAFYARGPIRLNLIGGSQYAFTINAGGDGAFIDMYLNPKVLFDIRNPDRAIRVWRGMGVHELAHHLWPAKEQYERAGREGGGVLVDLLNLLDDEQNERRARAMNPEWGSDLQTTVAWVFRGRGAKEEGFHDADRKGKEADLTKSASEVYLARRNEFAYYFRRNLPGASDPVVIEALAAVPSHLKDLSKDQLLALTLQVFGILTRGIDVPAPAPAEPVEQDKPAKPAAPAPTSPAGPVKKPFWKAIFTSGWSYLLMAAFVTAWVAFFARDGLAGWDNAFWVLLAVAGLAGVISLIMMWVDRLRQKMPRATGSSTAPGRWEAVKKAAGGGWQRVKETASKARDKILNPVIDGIVRVTPKPVAKACSAAYRAVRWVVVGIAKILGSVVMGLWWVCTRIWAKLTHWFPVLYRSKIVRTFLLSVPIAILLVMIAAMIAKANWWALLIFLIILLLLLFLAWLFRKRLKKFLQQPGRPDDEAGGEDGKDFNDDGEMLEFAVIHNIVRVEAKQNELDALLPDVIPLAQQMRPYLEQCGLVPFDVDDQEVGHELVEDLERAALGETALYVDEEKRPKASVHIEIGIDCSGSMKGEKIRLAKRFGLLLEESVRGVRGVSTRFWGFTDSAIYDCGTAGECRVSGLVAEGGNNDSAMLWHMYKSALTSGKDLKILLMVSDGAPTQCTWGSLHNLVCRLEMSGLVPVQIAVDRIADPAFKRWFVDLVGQEMASAIIEFGTILLSLVEEGK